MMFVAAIASCSHVKEQDFFRFDLMETGDRYQFRQLSLDDTQLPDVASSDCIVKDSLIINNEHRSEYLFHISDLDGKLLGSFCRRGRAWNEPLSGLSLFETYVENGNVCADVFSFMDAKLFVWNISESISEGRDVYEDIIQFESNDEAVLHPWMSLYRLDEDHIIVYNSMQSGYTDDLVGTPAYQIYALRERGLAVQFDLFNVVDIEPENPMLPKNALLTNVDCLKPDKTKLVFAMSLMPVYCILDLDTGKAEGYRIKGLPGLRMDEYRWQFADIQADDDYIYALYSGEIMFNKEGADIPDVLYVMDWDGHVKAKYKMDKRFTSLSLDNGKLYFIHHDGAIAIVDTDLIKRDLTE